MAAKRKKKAHNKKQQKSKTAAKAQLPSLPTSNLPTQDTIEDASQTRKESHDLECHFLQLPLELRRHIYGLLLDIRRVCGPQPAAGTARKKAHMIPSKASTPHAQLNTIILRVNKQIHEEALEFLWSVNHFVRLAIYSDNIDEAKDLLYHSDLTLVSTNPTALTKVTRHALDVEICEHRSKVKRCLVMFPASLLPRFVDCLRQICEGWPVWGRNHTFSLNLRNTYSDELDKVEKMLLEPWRRLHGLNDVVVGTQLVSPVYAKGLRDDMTSLVFKPLDWVRTLVEHKESGRKLLKEGKFEESCAASAIVGTIMINTFNEPAQARALRSMPSSFGQNVDRLRFQSELNVTLAILRLQKHKSQSDWWNMALQAANVAVDIAEGKSQWVWKNSTAPPLWQPANDAAWYTDTERAKSRFRRGWIMVTLGEYGYARGDLSIALELNPQDPTVRNMLTEAKEKYNPKARSGAVLDQYGIQVCWYSQL